MRFEIYNGALVGTAEWSEPGIVRLDVKDVEQKLWLERYFAGEDSFLVGCVDCVEMDMAIERRDSSPEAFTRAAVALDAYSFQVRDASEGSRR